MKTNAKRILFGLSFALASNLSMAQSGLEGIVVEKFYSSNAADAANASAQGAASALNAGSVTYRVYVDMAAGYKFSQLYGTAAHPLQVSTTTNFFNDPNYGSTTNPSAQSTANIRKNTALLDSWFTTGGAAAGKLGVLKTEDSDGSPGNAQGVLQNNPGGLFGLPINIGTTQSSSAADGMITGTVVAPNILGITATDLGMFDQTPGNNFVSTNGAIAALGGVVGPTASNMVLIGQFTTDGVFSFHLNVQLVKIATGAAENYVSSNPVSGEFTNASLNLVPNIPPTVSLTSPSNGAAIVTGTAVNLTANAADSDGTITQVEFLVDGVSVGVDATSPYTGTYTAVIGSHSIVARATDNSGDITTSSAVSITVANNQAPSVTVSAPSNAIEQDVVSITSTASDVDGTIQQVEFLVDNVVVGTDASSPYSFNWTATSGTHIIKARATDNLGLATTSTSTSIIVATNNPPSVSITSPLSTASYIAPSVVTIEASANDTDGSVASVQFYVNGVSIGTDATSPYSINWTSVPGTANITAKATDNKGSQTTSSTLTLTIADPNALPYEIGTVSQICNIPTFCVPFSAAVTNNVSNVIGYDVTLNYDKSKVYPTGNITLYNDMINSAYVESAYSIDSLNGKLNITLNFKGSAPAGTKYQGSGKLFCAEFTKLAAFTQVDTAAVSASFVQESYITGVTSKTASAGKAITKRNETFPMQLKYWKSGLPIKYNSGAPNQFLITKIFGANNSGVINTSTFSTPDTLGKVDYTLTNGQKVNVSRDIDNNSSVQLIVNAADAVLAKTLLLNQSGFTPNVYQMISMDVNMDGVISAGDVSQMKQRATLAIPEFMQAWNYTNAGVSNGQPSKDWLFLDSTKVQSDAAYQISATFPLNDNVGFSKGKVPVVSSIIDAKVSSYANCPVVLQETFRGVMLGDVDGSYETYSADGILKSNDFVILDLKNALVENGFVDVPVHVSSSNSVNALDIATKLNTNVLSFVSVITMDSDVEEFAYFNENDNTLRYTGFDVNNFDQGSPVTALRFKADAISKTDFQDIQVLLNGTLAQVAFEPSALGLSTQDVQAVSIYPNPTNQLVHITSPVDARLELVDVTGKLVLVENLIANKSMMLNVETFANGVYFVNTIGTNYQSSERLIINK